MRMLDNVIDITITRVKSTRFELTSSPSWHGIMVVIACNTIRVPYARKQPRNLPILMEAAITLIWRQPS